MKYYVIYFILVFGIMGCGSRNTETDISKQSSQVRKSEKNRSDETTKEQSRSTKKEENKNDITDTETTKTTTTEFDGTGKPIKQTTTEITRNKTDKSTNTKKEYHTINRTNLKHSLAYRDIIQTVTVKQKSKSTSRIDWSVYAFFGLLGVNVVYFGWRRIRKGS